MLIVLTHEGDHVVDHFVRTYEGGSALGRLRNYAAGDLLSDCGFAVEQHGEFLVETFALFTGGLRVRLL